MDIFERGRLPVSARDMVEKVFGKGPQSGSMVISGANGIVGAGKSIQFGSRLQPFGINLVALDLPGAADGIGKQYHGLVEGFGALHAAEVMANIIRMNYDGNQAPASLAKYKPKFLLEAIPEIVNLKKSHYAIFRDAFADIEIR
jgi:hypothetical protein